MEHQRSKKHIKTFLLLVLSFFLLFFSALAGFFVGKNTAKIVELQRELNSLNTGRYLLISAVANNDAGFTTISPDELGGNFDSEIVYLDLGDVNIEINGETMKLENAIRDGHITAEDIFAYARLDAKNGICNESYETEHGLTTFIYTYPEYDLRLIYDVYSTPDGKNHLINRINLYQKGSSTFTVYIDDESEYGYSLDREDWGLTLEATSTTPTSVTLNCTQSGGQQIGELETSYYILYYADGFGDVPTLEGVNQFVDYDSKTTIQMGTTSEFTIDWANIYGELCSGDYLLKLRISDIYDESQVHPLMENYYDNQEYVIEFSIP